MHLRATSFDPAMPIAGLCGEVSRVFDRSCHIRTSSGEAVFIVAEGLDCGPQTVRVSTPAQFSFAANLRPGTSVIRRGGILADHLAFEGQELEIDLRDARPWSSRPLPWPSRLSGATLQLLYQRLSDNTEAPPWVSSLDLLQATTDLDVSAALNKLDRRIGLGPGLTPAGDDFVVGYLLGLHVCEIGSIGRTQFRKHVCDWLAGQGHRTTDVSAAFFRAASAGRFTDTLVELAHAAARGDTDGITIAASMLLAQGASSGRYTLSGFTDATFSWSQE